MLSWPALATYSESGGTLIQSYLLEMKVDGTWTDVKGQDGSWDTASSYMVTGLTENTYYTFRVKARNV